VLGWLVVALLVFYVVTQPESAAEGARAIGAGVRRVAEGIGSFLGNLA